MAYATKEKERAYNQKRYWEEMRDPVKAQARRDRNREYSREYYRSKYRAPKGNCPICNKENVTLHQDHCHATDRQRERICMNCNLLLGHAQDKTEVLQKAIEYLDRHK